MTVFSSNDAQDCQWLIGTALRHLVVPSFREFVLFGNEDCPRRVELYDGVACDPIAAYDCDDEGNLHPSQDREAH